MSFSIRSVRRRKPKKLNAAEKKHLKFIVEEIVLANVEYQEAGSSDEDKDDAIEAANRYGEKLLKYVDELLLRRVEAWKTK